MNKIVGNLLISSAGRRVELVKAFQNSLRSFGVNAKVYATDMHPELSSACNVADGCFAVPAANDQQYIGSLIDICKKNNVSLVVPTIDTELELLSLNSDFFRAEGIDVLVSDQDFIRSCRDKRITGELFLSLDIPYPKVYDKDGLHFPCFCKPYDGSRSIGAKPIMDHSDLLDNDLNNPKNMFMELIPKTYCEYTVDAYYNKLGCLKSLVCRERLEVRSGEVSKGITRKDFVYDFLSSKLGYLEGAKGCITFQFFVNKEIKEIKGLEINPRFGGGYPLTHQSGARFTDYVISEYYLGRDVIFCDDWDSDLLMLRYDAAVFVKHES